MRKLIAVLSALTLYTGECAAQSWERVKPDGLGFEAEFPGKPELKESTGDDGGKIRTYVLLSQGSAYDVTVYDLQDGAVGPGDIDRVLDNMRDFSVHAVSATPRTEARIEISGQKARDLTADVMGMVWRSRLTIANNKIYQIVAIVSKAIEKSAETEKYIASFKLTGSSTEPGKPAN
ncbi:MAG: hypothetical protein ACKVP4_04965 [Hyphomicrobium sp.]